MSDLTWLSALSEPDAQARREHLRERLDDDRALAGRRVGGEQVDRLAVEAQRAVRVVLDQPQPGDRGGLGERGAALGAQRSPGRVLEGRDQVGGLGAGAGGGLDQRLWVRALVVATYNKRRSSSRSSNSSWKRLDGNQPSVIQITKRLSHSSPFAE